MVGCRVEGGKGQEEEEEGWGDSHNMGKDKGREEEGGKCIERGSERK